MSNPEQAPKPKRSRKVVAAAVAGTLVGGAVVLNKLGVIDVHTETRTEIKQPKVSIKKITPIDTGCFVRVDAAADLQADEHKRVGLGIGPFTVAHKDMWTNTTKGNYEGFGRLCVDGPDTDVKLITDNATGTSRLDVTVNRIYTEGFIDHNGHDGARTNRAFGQRVGELFGGDGNQNIKAGLDLVAQTLFEQTPCIDDAMRVAKASFKNHYVREADAISGGSVAEVDVHWETATIPKGHDIPTGKINKQLERIGVYIPDNWGIQSHNATCQAVEIGGKPGVASTN